MIFFFTSTNQHKQTKLF